MAEIKLKKENTSQLEMKNTREKILNQYKNDNQTLKSEIEKLMKDTNKNHTELIELKTVEEESLNKITKIQNELKINEDLKLTLKIKFKEASRIYNTQKMSLDSFRKQYDDSIKNLKDKER